MNRITGTNGAIINGRQTGLAGCHDSRMCSSADTCIRADARLVYRAHMAAGSTVRVQSCSVYIPIAPMVREVQS